ncbi:hypothetical protein HYV12_03180 [Candidatus Dojkabacteria bacterium]|nr:hypothetical protein [Candidatus Dojkabacteria bacterium]
MEKIILILIIFFADFLISPFLIKKLRDKGFYKRKDLPKEKQVQRNEKYYKHLLDDMSTPSSFGIFFILNLLVSIFLFTFNPTTLSVVIGSILLGSLGLADDIYQFFFYQRAGQWGFKARYKMVLQAIVFFVITYLISQSLLYSVVLSLLSTFILNSFNITDGLDGLAGGIAIPVFILFAYIEYSTFGFSSFFTLILVTVSFLLVFIFFNIKPAKVFLGDSGSYTIGVILAFLTFRYNLMYTLPLISLFLIEGLSSLIQIVSIKVFKKRVFSIAPLHLHLLNSGWSQWRVIKTAWVLQIVITILIFVILQYA